MLRVQALVNATAPAQTATFTFEWSERLQSLNLSAVAASSLDQPALALRSYALVPGLSYLFRLTVTDTAAPRGEGVSWTELSVLINRPPAGGTFTVIPRSVRDVMCWCLRVK
jgi:hypothetical protein